jgi:hypothetical protein
MCGIKRFPDAESILHLTTIGQSSVQLRLVRNRQARATERHGDTISL